MILAIVLGVASSLVLGVGMCVAMGVLGGGGTVLTVIGSVIGSIGIVGASINYPIYNKFLNGRKQKYANDVIALANSISEEE